MSIHRYLHNRYLPYPSWADTVRSAAESALQPDRISPLSFPLHIFFVQRLRRRQIVRQSMLCPSQIIAAILFCQLLAYSGWAATVRLRTAAEVRKLTASEADEHLPVVLEGVITYSERDWYLTFLSDASGGIYLGTSLEKSVPTGSWVRVSGVTAHGKGLPIVRGRERQEPEMTLIPPGTPPEPIEADPARVRGLEYDSQLIRVHGWVRSVTRENDRAVVELALGDITLRASLPGYGDTRPLPFYLVKRPVTVVGVFGTRWTDRGTTGERVLYVPSLEAFVIDPAYLEEQFRRPPRTYSELFLKKTAEDALPFCLEGKLGFAKPGRGFFFQAWEDGHSSGSLWVETADPGAFRPGQMARVIGRLEMENRKPILRDALVRILRDGPGIIPQRIDPETTSPSDYHGVRVEIEGTLLEQHGGLENESLVILSGRSAVSASQELLPRTPRFPTFEKGSQLRITGTVLAPSLQAVDLKRGPLSFQLVLDASDTVHVLSTPGWWTVRKALWALSGALAVAAGAFTWVSALRTRVRKQTEIIRRHLERQTIHEERVRISREFHDSFEQNLVGIGLTLQAAGAELGEPERVSQLLQQAEEMTRHTREEARHAIWELRTGAAGFAELEANLRAHLSTLAEAACIDLRIESSGEPVSLSGVVYNHLLRIAQESFTNTLKHAHATSVEILLGYSGSTVDLQIADDGIGFVPADAVQKDFCGFGLTGMRERALRAGGTFEVESRPGEGTRVRVRMPACPVAQ